MKYFADQGMKFVVNFGCSILDVDRFKLFVLNIGALATTDMFELLPSGVGTDVAE